MTSQIGINVSVEISASIFRVNKDGDTRSFCSISASSNIEVARRITSVLQSVTRISCQSLVVDEATLSGGGVVIVKERQKYLKKKCPYAVLLIRNRTGAAMRKNLGL